MSYARVTPSLVSSRPFLETRDVNLLFPPYFLSHTVATDIPPLLPRPPKPQLPEEPIPAPVEGVSVRSVIEYLERQKCNATVDINAVVSQFCVRRKTIYDMMSIMTALGVASRVSATSYRWCGIGHIDGAVAFIQQARARSAVQQPIEAMFKCAKDASLGNLSLSLLKLFWYLGREKLNIRTVATLFAQRDIRLSSILRRLVVIANCLQAVGVARCDKSGEAIELFHPDLCALVAENKQNPATQLHLREFEQLRPFR